MNHQVNDLYEVTFIELGKPEVESDFVKKLKESGLKFSYYRADRKFYLFLYGDKFKDRNDILNEIKLLRILDRKKRRFQSLRGYFRMGLEMRKKAKGLKELETNLDDFFWEKLDRALRKNQKNSFEDYIFDVSESSELEKLMHEVSLLKKRVEMLENRLGASNMEDYKNWKEIEKLELKEVVIQGFKLLKEGKLSLPEFYEGEEELSLFDWKNYKLKYNTLRKSSFYKNLNKRKEEFL